MISLELPEVELDYSSRPLVWATFDLNRALGGRDTTGYHVFNVLVHLSCGLLLFGLLRRTLARIPGPLGPATRENLAFVTTALWLCHPLQTQAVTYVVQRLASMAAMFYLAALACYVRARLAPAVSGRVLWAGATVVLAGLALFSKENAATLPAAILLLEVVFFPHDRRSVGRLAWAAIAGFALVWLLAAIAFEGNPLSLRSMDALAAQTTAISRASYLATQLPILWTYLRLFVLPDGLHLDYPDEPLRSFGQALPWIALAGHLALIALAIGAWRRRPIVTFGALFYYLAHAVESSVIPIPELAFEHRAYLPNAGLCLIAGWMLLAELPRRCREVFVLRRREQLSYEAIGARLGVSLGTVKSQMWRAVVLLRRKLARVCFRHDFSCGCDSPCERKEKPLSAAPRRPRHRFQGRVALQVIPAGRKVTIGDS